MNLNEKQIAIQKSEESDEDKVPDGKRVYGMYCI